MTHRCTVRVSQRTIPCPITQLEQDVQQALAYLGYAAFGCTLWITTDATIRRYNRTFRQVDAATDILSFPYHAEVAPGTRIIPAHDDDAYLGDLMISAAYVQRAAVQLGVSYEDHLRRLVVHGICHLLNYDHATREEFEQMNVLERELVAHLGIRDTVGDYYKAA